MYVGLLRSVATRTADLSANDDVQRHKLQVFMALRFVVRVLIFRLLFSRRRARQRKLQQDFLL